MTLIERDEIETAVEAVASSCLRTPVLAMPAGGPNLWLKAECLQPIGAFKLRGATNAIASLTAEQRRAGVVTHSSGNHGQAVAYAAAAAGIDATVVMPEGAATVKVEATRRWGAEIVFVPYERRQSACLEIAERSGAEVIEPFDDARVIAGQATIGWELIEQLPDLAAVLVPVGGGGLLSGVAAAVKLRRPDISVIAAEPELAGDLAEGFRTGERSTWEVERTSRTIADALRSSAVGDLNWVHIRRYVDDVVTVSEAAIRDAMREIPLGARIVAEPAGAVATAAYFEHGSVLPVGTTAAIVSGGNVEPPLLADILSTPR